ncbi:MAG: hypothetical protein GY799_21055 [Desulfobulbaceae bacterium]|nr:hypothetical protein [Desulfobulbaceae bacterium]
MAEFAHRSGEFTLFNYLMDVYTEIDAGVDLVVSEYNEEQRSTNEELSIILAKLSK